MTLFVERFRAVAASHPERTAVESGAVRLTYGELLARAVRLGERLQALGAGPECLVGLGLDKSPDYVLAILGVWFAGAAFLPLDRRHPPERLAFLVQDSGAALVILQPEHRDLFAHLRVPLFELDDPAASGAAEGAAAIQNPKSKIQNSPGSLAYVIYTSGSTGAPKGVRVAHWGIVNVLEAQIPIFGLGPASRSLFYLSSSFDASISDIGTALLAGATLCIEPACALETAAGLMETLRTRRITHIDLPPALLRILEPAQAPECLETIIIGGETCLPAVVRRWAARCRVVNVYGPTEATICVSLCVCSPETWDRPLIGRPIPHVSLHLLDAEGRPAPFGTPGELCIGGIGLALGYVNRPELDAAKFILHDGERLYRTGDRVVRHADGEIEFLGRIDRQVKRHGVLIAPEEIEAQLLRHPAVEEAAVVTRGAGPGREILVAFIAARPGSAPSAAVLRRHLASALPAGMLPQRYELRERLPRTSTGKIELAELACCPLSAGPPGGAGGPPTTDEEQRLAAIWQRVLGIESVGIADDFFALGGDSLGVLEVAAAAEAGGMSIAPALMVAHRTIAGTLAGRRGTPAGGQEAAGAEALRADVALSPEWQERLRAARARPGASPPRGAPAIILLTGATGFLGSRLLDALLHRTRAQILCLVRAGSPAEGRRRCREALARHGHALSPALETRIAPLLGDVAAPRLGLAAGEWARLAAEVDTVYHCAAQVNMLLPYPALRPSNVGGTQEVLRLLCEGRRKRLHYASTLSVFVATDRREGRMEEADGLERTEVVFGGYAQSKWSAEYLLRARCGETPPSAGPIAVYRFGLITGDSRTGRAAPHDFLGMFFRGTAALGCVPENGGAGLKVDVTPVDFAAAAMAHLSLHVAAEGGLSTFHVANPRSASVAELIDALRAVGAPIAAVAEDEWQRRLEAGLHGAASASVPAAYLALCRCLSAQGAFERHRSLDLFQATGAEFDMTNTLAGLRSSGLACPPPTQELLRTYARYALGEEQRGVSPAGNCESAKICETI